MRCCHSPHCLTSMWNSPKASVPLYFREFVFFERTSSAMRSVNERRVQKSTATRVQKSTASVALRIRYHSSVRKCTSVKLAKCASPVCESDTLVCESPIAVCEFTSVGSGPPAVPARPEAYTTGNSHCSSEAPSSTNRSTVASNTQSGRDPGLKMAAEGTS